MAKDRPLERVIEKLGRIDTRIGRIIMERGRADVLEIGCGHGLPMHQLKHMFGDRLRIVGMNLRPEHGSSYLSFRDALSRGIFTEKDVEQLVCYKHLPYYVHGDAGRHLPFSDGYFDFVYSICAAPFVHDKIHMLEEVNRVLKDGCIARIEFPVSEDVLDTHLTFLEILDGERIVPFRECVNGLSNMRYSPDGKYIVIRKVPHIDMGLELVATDDLSKIDAKYYGVKSMYKVRE
jgi:SAM-dependent methyltransferase